MIVTEADLTTLRCGVIRAEMVGDVPTIAETNSLAAEMLGYEVQELIGRPVSTLVMDYDREKETAAIRAAAVSVEFQSSALVATARCKDGSALLIMHRVGKRTREDGGITFLALIAPLSARVSRL